MKSKGGRGYVRNRGEGHLTVLTRTHSLMRFLTILVTSLFLCACGQVDTFASAAEASVESHGQKKIYIPTGALEMEEPEGAKIIRTGRMNFEVAELERAKQRTDSLVRIAGGYYGSEQYSDSYQTLVYNLNIRIPANRFEEFVSALERGSGKLTDKYFDAKDVTEEYQDTEIRLANKVAYLAQYQAILKEARTIAEVLEVQEKIRGLEEEIEARKGRLRYLDKQVGYATLDVQLREEVEPAVAEGRGVWARVGKAFVGGGEGVLEFFVVVVYLWPVVLVLGVVLGWFFWRRRKKKGRG